METVKFSDVVTRANTKEDRFNTDKIYYVGGEHIDSNEMKIEKRGIIAGSTIGPMFYCGFKSGDILFVTRNPHLRKCGVVDFDGICSEKTFVLETKNKEVLLQEYLAIVMQSDDFWNYCEENKSGGVNYFLNWSTLAEYEFPLPTIAEQKVLAEKLWAAYEVKQSYLKMIEATQEMVKSQFIEMFYNDKYPLQKLNTHIYVIRGVSYKPTDIREGESDDSSVILRSNNIDNGQINYDDVVYVDNERISKEQVVSIGDIVMCGSNGSKTLVGKAAMIDSVPAHQTSFGAFCLGIRCKESVHPKYLTTYFQTSKYRDVIEFLGSGSNILNIKPEHIYNLEIPVPSIEEQKQFVSIAEQADKSISELCKSVDAIDKVIKSLINENL